jgi:putative transposase
LLEEFVFFLAVVLLFAARDRLALEKGLCAAIALDALKMALNSRNPEPGLVHHSDRSVQYAPTTPHCCWNEAFKSA